MTQNPVQVPTAAPLSGLTLVTDVNNALAALSSLFSGATAPTTTSLGLSSLAGVLWHDTANNLLKLRNQADSAWITLGSLDETNNLYSPAIKNDASLRQKSDGTWQVNETVTQIAATPTLSASNHFGNFVATAAMTVSLPSSTGLWNGYCFSLLAQGGAVILSPASGEKIIYGSSAGTASANVTVSQGSSAFVVTDGAGNWYLLFQFQQVTSMSVPVRQTVLAGDASSSGTAAFLTTGSGLTPAYTASNPLYLAFANGFSSNGASDMVAKLATGGSTVACSANLLNYLYAVYSSATAVTWGATPAPVQYGQAYNQTAQSSLTLNNSSLDDFGNSWTNTSVTFTSSSPMLSGSYMGVFNGSSSKMSSASFTSLGPLGNGGWSMRTWFKTPVNNVAQAVMSAVNASGYGAVVYLTNGGNILVDLSSTGSTRDIANAVSVAPYAANTAYFVELTYDPVAGKYYLYVNGTGYTVATSTLKIGAISTVSLGYGGPISGGYLGGGSTAWAQGFEILPYCQHPAGTSYSVPTALASVATAGYASDWFDTTNMAMKSPSVASTAAGNNPTFTTSSKLYVGEATAGASAISSVVSYAFQGQYIAPWVSTLPSAQVAFAHNLGASAYTAALEVMNLTAENGWLPGDTSDEVQASCGSYGAPRPGMKKNRNYLYLAPPTVSSTVYWGIGNPSTGSVPGVTAMTVTNWAYRIRVKRSF